jgi:hypothetical protein
MTDGTLARIEKRLMTRTVHRGLTNIISRAMPGHRSRRRRHPGVMP